MDASCALPILLACFGVLWYVALIVEHFKSKGKDK